MKHHLRAAIAVATLVSLPVVGAAQTMTNTAPISVQSVAANNGEAVMEATGRSSVPNTIDVSFQNSGTKTASRVVFDVRSGADDVGQIVDVGQFAPGAEIVRHYDNTFDSVAPLTDASVAPVEVDYSDGSVWKANA